MPRLPDTREAHWLSRTGVPRAGAAPTSGVARALADATLCDALAFGLDERPSPEAVQLAQALARAFGPATVAIIHYGSHAHRSGASAGSAHDFFVIVDWYRHAYRALARAMTRAPAPAAAALLAHILPPNVVAVTPPGAPSGTTAKCAVVSLHHLRLAAAGRALDHFVQGRLFQHVQLVWARDADAREAVCQALVALRARTFLWGRAHLPATFTVETYCRVLLDTSFAAEVRPEGSDRVAQLVSAQGEVLRPVYGALLQALARERILGGDGNVYTLSHPVSPVTAARLRFYFGHSKLRATLRWLKYVALYDEWLDYIVRKVERRSGRAVVLTERERRWPLIFLWPKALEYLRSRPQRQP